MPERKVNKLIHPGFSDIWVSWPLGFLAKLMNSLHLDEACLRFQKAHFRSGYIRAVNYHDVASDNLSSFERHLRLFRSYFSPVSISDLEIFFREKLWRKKTPGLIISFDDGFRSHSSTVAPLLEKYGFTGWFFVPTDFISVPCFEQVNYSKSHDICLEYGDHENGRLAMSWDEIKALDHKHVVVSHTRSHLRFRRSVPDHMLLKEIFGSKKILEDMLGHELKCFGWVGGEVETYSPQAAKWIREAGYKFAFMTKSSPIIPITSTHHLHRTFLHPSWPLHIVRLHLSGVLDLLYFRQRRQVNRQTHKRS